MLILWELYFGSSPSSGRRSVGNFRTRRYVRQSVRTSSDEKLFGTERNTVSDMIRRFSRNVLPRYRTCERSRRSGQAPIVAVTSATDRSLCVGVYNIVGVTLRLRPSTRVRGRTTTIIITVGATAAETAPTTAAASVIAAAAVIAAG